ncbi:MAG: hypothetical protein R6X22_01720 [Gemmatimonadota bacterium]
MRYLSRKGLTAFGIGLALVVAACGEDTTAPGGGLPSDDAVINDPQAVVQAVDALGDVFDSEQFRSLAALDGAPGLDAVGGQIGAAMVSLLRAAGSEEGTAVQLPGTLGALAETGASFALIPAEALGRTYEWDAATSGYADLGTPGAPANGMRIVLYVMNEATGTPVMPLQTVGYMQMTETSDSISAQIVGPGGVVYIELTITVTAHNRLYIEGFAQSSSNRIDLEAEYVEWIEKNQPQFEECTAMADVGLCADTGFELEINLDVMSPPTHVDVYYSLFFNDSGWDIVRRNAFDQYGDFYQVITNKYFEAIGGLHYIATYDITFLVEGITVGTIEAVGDELVFKGEGGVVLTEEEMLAVQSMYGAPYQIMVAFQQMVSPLVRITGMPMLLPPDGDGLPAGATCDEEGCSVGG